MLTKVLLLGGSGLLGSAIKHALIDSGVSFLAPSSKELNLLDRNKVIDYFDAHEFDYVINATGYNKVDLAESSTEEFDKCLALNFEVPKFLIELSERHNFKFIQFSSDYVFDGKNPEGYIEEDVRNPLNNYGISKLKAEDAVLDSKNGYIFRVSWLFGPNGPNFVKSIIEQSKLAEPIKVVSDQFGKPSYTLDIASKLIFALPELVPGIYHLPNEGQASWFDLATKAIDFASLQANITQISSSELNRLAKRPKYSILCNKKLDLQRDYKLALKEYCLNLDVL